ncbi:folic acid synthesis protein [Niveomyces insectorum RCEF 264]|uniref:2-amino-4-hydroxy-6-hydroxymethyldihydropteridine diphosphokinase n=1 Tax=Niveomyces insectorum RCEF 264 TaxID=1081102 RepID=A0A167MWA5_9HYPO|nr:folic acid synthesis protein [Niveomyces insectorum RCEF 264]
MSRCEYSCPSRVCVTRGRLLVATRRLHAAPVGRRFGSRPALPGQGISASCRRRTGGSSTPFRAMASGSPTAAVPAAAPAPAPDPAPVSAPEPEPTASTTPVTAYIALGSNLGDRIGWIEQACNEMDRRGIRVRRTSSLWETDPMYVLDQDKFVNGVAEVATDLPPLALLDQLQDIERTLGRQKLVDKGPRNIDLDILLYGDQVVRHPRLTVPHAGMAEREFVLRPLAQ